MSARRLVQVALLAVVAVTLVMVFRPKTEGSSVAASAVESESTTGTTYVVYYFHGNVRCDTCRSIEARAEEAVRSGFADEIGEGTLLWRVVNSDKPENAHFVDEFGLTHSTVVIVERQGKDTRRFVTLDRVWELVHDEDDQFRDYVQAEIANWVRAGS